MCGGADGIVAHESVNPWPALGDRCDLAASDYFGNVSREITYKKVVANAAPVLCYKVLTMLKENMVSMQA